MNDIATVSIIDIENQVNKLFELENQIRDKDIKIAALEFEVALQKQLYENLRQMSLFWVSVL